jgi:hypothetical protein
MKPVREFYNVKDKCFDRKYEIHKENWLQQRTASKPNKCLDKF